MYITVQFKDKFKIFKGKTYDFKLAPAEEIPKVGSIIRMYTPDFSKTVCNATRVKVVGLKKESNSASEMISYIETSLDN